MKLDASKRECVAFEIDGFDEEHKTGWSVVVEGMAEEMSVFDGPARQGRLRDLAVEPWAGGHKLHWVRIASQLMTGRRLPA
jgi:hypothetical protein